MDLPNKYQWLMFALLGIALISILRLFAPLHTESPTSHHWELTEYYEIGPVQTIQEIDDNLSGLTYHPGENLLYGVLNNPEQIVVLSKTGDLLRRIPLSGFRDTESIDYVLGNQFIVSEERHHRIHLLEITKDTVEINVDATKVLYDATQSGDNRGIEGIIWSERYGLLMAQEEPAKFIQYAVTTEQTGNMLERLLSNQFTARDFSGLAYIDEVQPKLLALSDLSHAVFVIDLHGNELSSLRLGKGPFNLWPIMKQPEGIALDRENNIYIVGEPNQFLVLKRRDNL